MNEPISSPCNNICSIDPNSGLCLGCDRTLSEIGEWASATDIRKKEILTLLESRKKSKN